MSCFFAIILLLSLSGINGDIFKEEVLSKDPHVLLKWRIEKSLGKIIFEIEAETKGWVGIGFSPSGSMEGADMFIGGVRDDGTNYSGDYHALSNAQPILDEHTDWELESASEPGNKTFLRVSRLLNTCDQQDYLIDDGTVRVIWGIGGSDEIWKHSHKGSVSMDFFETTPDVDLTKMLKHRIKVRREMPSNLTTYWCSIHQGPLISKKHHIVAFEAFLPSSEALKHTHHFILYRCHGNRTYPTEKAIKDIRNPDADCYTDTDDPSSVGMQKLKTCSEYIFTWAKGGKRMVLPPHVGYPFGDKDQTYFMLEVHYDNPEQTAGLTFSTGVDIYYTDEPRSQEAGILTVGHELFVWGGRFSLIVPPRTSNFTVAGHCGGFCTEDNLPSEGIKVFNVLLHSHMAGRKLKLRHFRGNETELPFILKDDTYNFDYQQNRHLPQEIGIEKGDHLIYECNYSSGNDGKVVIGGLPTHEEMCMAFLWYYPRIEGFDKCTSNPSARFQTDFEDVEYVFPLNRADLVFGGYGLALNESGKEVPLNDYLETMYEWNETSVRRLEASRRFGGHKGFCGGRYDETDHMHRGLITYPEKFVPYQPPQQKCTNTPKEESTNDWGEFLKNFISAFIM